jgi:mannose-6-phosphate isomerase-like protein (cupin superfamily)
MRKYFVDQKMKGFQDVAFSTSWRFSYADYDENVNDLSHVRKMEKHLDTEEGFFLMKGKMVIVTAGNGEKPESFIITPMYPGELVIVEKNEWHVGVYAPSSATVIIENKEDSKSFSYMLDNDQITLLHKLIL